MTDSGAGFAAFQISVGLILSAWNIASAIGRLTAAIRKREEP